MDNWTAPRYNIMKHTIVLGGSQFARCIPLSKREAKIKHSSRETSRSIYKSTRERVHSITHLRWRLSFPSNYHF